MWCEWEESVWVEGVGVVLSGCGLDKNDVRGFGKVWCGEVWFGNVWCGKVWCGKVWCEEVWCEEVRCEKCVFKIVM